MSEIKQLGDTPLQTVIDKNAALVTAARVAADYNNSSELDTHCVAFLTVQFDTTAPTAGDPIAELYVLPGNGEVSEVFPQGGDGTVGADVDPQSVFLMGVFETISPSISVDEVVALPNVPLYPAGNRFVLKNTSGQQFDLTYQLDIKPAKFQAV